MAAVFDAEKLAKMQAMAGARVGAKGTPRRKVIPRAAQGDDSKIQAALKKLAVQPIAGIEEINMFKSDGNLLRFGNGKGVVVHGAASNNVYAVYAQPTIKPIAEFIQTIMPQLGERELGALSASMNLAGLGGAGAGELEADDELPELVEAVELKESGLEEIN